MKDTKLIQHIISELENSPLEWKGNRELFELLFAPIRYGDESAYHRRKAIKPILKKVTKYDEFDRNTFSKLANNIFCGDDEPKLREHLKQMLKNYFDDKELERLVGDIPCKDKNEKNYKTHFIDQWRKKDRNIQDTRIKKALQRNFDFSSKLWGSGEVVVKESLKSGIAKFIKKQLSKDIDIFAQMREEFQMQSSITDAELNDLQQIRGMNQVEIMEYISEHYLLDKNKSQEFILKFINILDKKGYYKLLLEDAFEVLEPRFKESKEVKLVLAHAYGSAEVNRPKKAFEILSTIKPIDYDMLTEAVSNMRRYQLNDESLNKEHKKEIIKNITTFYKKAFYHDDSKHYYPGVNLAYITSLTEILFLDEIVTKHTVSQLHTESKNSIKSDKESKNYQTRYYAQMADIEFMLLKNSPNAIHELEYFLENNSQSISLVEIGRTQRQMQFFVDTVEKFAKDDEDVVENMKKAIRIIDDFMEYQAEWE